MAIERSCDNSPMRSNAEGPSRYSSQSDHRRYVKRQHFAGDVLMRDRPSQSWASPRSPVCREITYKRVIGSMIVATTETTKDCRISSVAGRRSIGQEKCIELSGFELTHQFHSTGYARAEPHVCEGLAPAGLVIAPAAKGAASFIRLFSLAIRSDPPRCCAVVSKFRPLT